MGVLSVTQRTVPKASTRNTRSTELVSWRGCWPNVEMQAAAERVRALATILVWPIPTLLSPLFPQVNGRLAKS